LYVPILKTGDAATVVYYSDVINELQVFWLLFYGRCWWWVTELFVADEFFANCPMISEAYIINDQL